MENEGKGEGGSGVGTGKGTGKSMHKHLSKLPFSKLPFCFSPVLGGLTGQKKGSEMVTTSSVDAICLPLVSEISSALQQFSTVCKLGAL